MNNAELYHNSNNLQKRDALQCLEEYAKKISWKNCNDRIIDIGCGDGSVTSRILKKYIPNKFGKLLGCDISEKMIKFANDNHAGDATSFKLLDIEGELPTELRASFDHAFSFYVLHWIKHQESAFMNIYDLLADGGDCLLIFLGHMPLFDVYRIMARSAKWNTWLKDVDRYISPYHDLQDPEKEIRRMMNNIGFVNVEVQCKEKCFVYDSISAVKKAVMAVNPFEIPKDLYDDFLEDYLSVVSDMRLIDQDNNHINVRTNYSLLIAYGKKNLKSN